MLGYLETMLRSELHQAGVPLIRPAALVELSEGDFFGLHAGSVPLCVWVDEFLVAGVRRTTWTFFESRGAPGILTVPKALRRIGYRSITEARRSRSQLRWVVPAGAK